MGDVNILDALMESVNSDSQIFTEMVDRVVKEYSNDLDGLMEDLRIAVTQSDAIATESVERYYAELSNMVYFMVDRLEKLNVFSDLSKAKMKEAYNRVYLQVSAEKDEKGKSIRTVNENTALAEDGSKYESVMNTVYDHAYKSLKNKVDMAMEMISTLKNILKRRSQEDYLSFSMNNLKANMVGDDD